jgi:uncharacterized protein YxeA
MKKILISLFLIIVLLVLAVSCLLEQNLDEDKAYVVVTPPSSRSITAADPSVAADMQLQIHVYADDEKTRYAYVDIEDKTIKIEVPAGPDLNIHVVAKHKDFFVYHDKERVTLKAGDTKSLDFTLRRSVLNLYTELENYEIVGSAETSTHLFFCTKNNGVYYYEKGQTHDLQAVTITGLSSTLTGVTAFALVEDYRGTVSGTEPNKTIWIASSSGIRRCIIDNASLTEEQVNIKTDDPTGIVKIYGVQLTSDDFPNNDYLYVAETSSGFSMINSNGDGTFEGEEWTHFNIKEYFDFTNLVADIAVSDLFNPGPNEYKYIFIATALGTIVDYSNKFVDPENLDLLSLKIVQTQGSELPFFSLDYNSTTDIMYLGASDGLYSVDITTTAWYNYIQGSEVLYQIPREQELDDLRYIDIQSTSLRSIASNFVVNVYHDSAWHAISMWDGIAHTSDLRRSNIRFQFMDNSASPHVWIGTKEGLVSYPTQ